MSDMKIKNPKGNHGGFFNGPNNGQIIINSPGGDEPNPFHVRKRRVLPIGERGLNAMAAFMTVVTGLGGWKTVQHVIDTFPFGKAADVNTSSPTTSQPDWAMIVPLALMCIGFICLVGLLLLRRRVRTRTMGFSPTSLTPTIAGVIGEDGKSKLALLRLEGNCERAVGNKQCGGSLKFYNKPTYESFEDKEGNLKRRVAYRTPTAECRRNRAHCYEIDIADVE